MEENSCLGEGKVLTSSGFPRAAAVLEHSFFRKSSEKELAAKLLCKSMKGILTTTGTRSGQDRSADNSVDKDERPVTTQQTQPTSSGCKLQNTCCD